MTTSKSLPDRPSLESLRKQAKKLARDIAAGDAPAMARARAHLPNADLPLDALTQRKAQLVIAREYGYAGWQDLTAEVSKRLGHGLEWAAAQARRVIHDNDLERLKQLLAEYPALLSWRDDDDHGGVLGFATGAYGDAGDPEREKWFTRVECAELLIDAGAIVMPSVCEGLLQSRAKGLLQLFHRKGLLPRTLTFLAALGDIDAVRTALNETGNEPAVVNEAFVRACLFDHEAVASLLFDQCIALDPELGGRVDASVGRRAFIKYFIEMRPDTVREIGGQTITIGLWKAFVMEHIRRAVLDNDLTVFVHGLQRERWTLGDEYVWFQNGLISNATLHGRGEFISALFDLDPAILRRQPPPPSQAIEHAFTYAKTHVLPLLLRIWPLPDDLPHAAGTGDLARVRRWFDAEGKPALGDAANHAPATSVHPREPQWGGVGAQQVLDTALAWSVLNHHFAVADFLLEHGADIDTNWNSHEPASILHTLVFEDDYEAMRFLIDRGIDMTIKDYRWDATAWGWARYGKNDEKMAQWLEDAERQRQQRR
jgi:hypothetical protein